jgi:hypothetical protein
MEKGRALAIDQSELSIGNDIRPAGASRCYFVRTEVKS